MLPVLDGASPAWRSWDALLTTASGLAGWTPETELFVYSERVARCELRRQAVKEAQEPDQGFECRLFDGTCEVRCVADDGQLRAWVIREKSNGQPVRVLHRRYYLVGISTTTPDKFREARYPDVVFQFPVSGGAAGVDRAWIEVAEYYRAEPAWRELSAEDVRRHLAEPLLVAHRFVSVGIGQQKIGE